MQFIVDSSIVKNRFGPFLLAIFAGLAIGFTILFFFSILGLTLATFCSMGILFPFMVIIIGDSKRLLWAILVVCLPISVDYTIGHTGHLGGAAGYMISLHDIVLAVLYLLWFSESISNKKAKIELYPAITFPAVLLIGFACLSIIPAIYPNYSVYEIVELIKMYLTFLYLANNIKTKKDFQFIIILFVACLFFEGLLGWAQHRYDSPFFPTALGGPGWIDSRVKGTWVSYNDFAWYLTFFIPLSISMVFSKIKTVYKIACLLISAVASGTLMWTNSRSGWVSLGMAVLFMGFLIVSKIREKKAFINIFLTAILILILIFPLYPRLYNKIYGRFAGHDGGSAESRLPQFEIAYNIIKSNPILGIGINNYSEVMWEYDVTEGRIRELTVYPVHNIYLHLAAEIGIFGFAMFMLILAVIFYTGLNYVILNSGFEAYVIIGLLAGILAFLIHGLFDVASIGSKMFMFVWFFAGILFGVKEIEQEGQDVIE